LAEWIGKETGACLGYRYPPAVKAEDIAMFHVKHLGHPKDKRSNQRKPMARKITHRWVGETDFSNSEQGFVAGYLAHLTANEAWM
jgi:hypothetical protein